MTRLRTPCTSPRSMPSPRQGPATNQPDHERLHTLILLPALRVWFGCASGGVQVRPSPIGSRRCRRRRRSSPRTTVVRARARACGRRSAGTAAWPRRGDRCRDSRATSRRCDVSSYGSCSSRRSNSRIAASWIVAGDAPVGERGRDREVRGTRLLPAARRASRRTDRPRARRRCTSPRPTRACRWRPRRHPADAPRALRRRRRGSGRHRARRVRCRRAANRRRPSRSTRRRSACPGSSTERTVANATESRLASFGSSIVGPQPIHRLLARQRSPAPREQHLEQVACLA